MQISSLKGFHMEIQPQNEDLGNEVVVKSRCLWLLFFKISSMIFILLVYKVDLYAGEERRSKSQWHSEQGINEREKIFKEK